MTIDPPHHGPHKRQPPYSALEVIGIISIIALFSAIFNVAGWAHSVEGILKGIGALGTFLAVLVAIKVLEQRSESDNRDAWWNRAAKSIELMTSDDIQAVSTGTAMALYLARSELASDDDRAMFAEVNQIVINRIKDEGGGVSTRRQRLTNAIQRCAHCQKRPGHRETPKQPGVTAVA